MLHRSLILLIFALLTPAPTRGADPPASRGDIEFFEKKVRPLLVRRCYACHSSKAQPLQGNLRLDLRSGLRRGGSRGPALVAGDQATSRASMRAC